MNQWKEKLENNKVPIVKEYSDVFLEESTSLPLDRKIEFVIDLVPVNKPISKASHTMALDELKELKI